MNCFFKTCLQQVVGTEVSRDKEPYILWEEDHWNNDRKTQVAEQPITSLRRFIGDVNET